jgi:hypothetical protein
MGWGSSEWPGVCEGGGRVWSEMVQRVEGNRRLGGVVGTGGSGEPGGKNKIRIFETAQCLDFNVDIGVSNV